MPRYKVGDEIEFSVPALYRGTVLEIVREGAASGDGDVYKVGPYKRVGTIPNLEQASKFIVRDDTCGQPSQRVVPHAIAPVD